MVEFDADLVARAVGARSNEQKWSPDQMAIVSGICSWYVAHPDAHVEYEDGQPGTGMRQMIDDVSRKTGVDADRILTSFGAAHCLLCDTVPGFRPVLYSAWDRPDTRRE